MSLAIRWGLDSSNVSTNNSPSKAGFIYFDAVTVFSQSHRGQVTKHPIALGSNITDHFIRENPSFTLSGVISPVDLSLGSYLIQDLDGNSPYNVFEPPTAVSVNSTDQSTLDKLLPDSIGQFLPDTTPVVTLDEGREDFLSIVKEGLTDIMSGVIYNDATGNFEPDIQLVELYEFDDYLLRRISNNLVITNILFKEDTNSGEGLYIDLTLERVEFAYLKRTVIPKDVSDALKKKAETKKDKGKADSTVKTEGADGTNNSDAPDDTDPLREAKANG